MGYISISLKNNNITNINSENLMNIASTFSLITVPLELINVKDYLNNLKLTKANHKALIYENDNEKEKNKSKTVIK